MNSLQSTASNTVTKQIATNAISITPQDVQPTTAAWNDFKQGINTFSFEFLNSQVTCSNEGNNLLNSPLSISIVMGMLKHSVDAEAKRELEAIVRLPENETVLQSCVLRLMKELPQIGVQIANLLYLNSQYRLNPDYRDLVIRNYQGMAKEGHSADDVNSWVSGVTQGQIKQLLTPEDLQDFFVVLANAIHFKAKWASEFKTRNTYEDSFFAPTGTKLVEMMNQTTSTQYFENAYCQAIEMPYKGTNVKMVLVLPKYPNDFTFVNEDYFKLLSSEMKEQLVAISLPKCKLEQQIDVRNGLAIMGMKYVLGKPDFSNLVDLHHAPSMAARDEIYISTITQKTVVDIKEEGTEASSATAIVCSRESCSIGPRPTPIQFNRPYLAAIMYEGMPLIFSVVRDPS